MKYKYVVFPLFIFNIILCYLYLLIFNINIIEHKTAILFCSMEGIIGIVPGLIILVSENAFLKIKREHIVKAFFIGFFASFVIWGSLVLALLFGIINYGFCDYYFNNYGNLAHVMFGFNVLCCYSGGFLYVMAAILTC